MLFRSHPVQSAFIAHDAFQCGFCTPGQIMSAIGLIREGQAGADPERVREGMSGNLCRCGAYAGITEAVLEAQRQMAGFSAGSSTTQARSSSPRKRGPRASDVAAALDSRFRGNDEDAAIAGVRPLTKRLHGERRAWE